MDTNRRDWHWQIIYGTSLVNTIPSLQHLSISCSLSPCIQISLSVCLHLLFLLLHHMSPPFNDNFIRLLHCLSRILSVSTSPTPFFVPYFDFFRYSLSHQCLPIFFLDILIRPSQKFFFPMNGAPDFFNSLRGQKVDTSFIFL